MIEEHSSSSATPTTTSFPVCFRRIGGAAHKKEATIIANYLSVPLEELKKKVQYKFVVCLDEV